MAEVDWAGLIHREDVESLWSALYRLVSRHPSTRPLRFATDEAAVISEFEINADLTQELFLELFEKRRFEYYMTNSYGSTDIEKELTHIELPNMVGARLRKRYPESFRLARRVSVLLKSSPTFKRLDCSEGDDSKPPGKKSGRGATNQTSSRRGRPTRRLAFQNGKPSSAAVRIQEVNPKSKLVGLADLACLEQTSALPAVAIDGYCGQSALPVNHVEVDDPDAAALAGLVEDDDDEATVTGPAQGPRRQRMVNQRYGLKKWAVNKPAGDSGHFIERAKAVPVRKRDTRIVGRSGSSQLILSNPDLEKLIVEVLEAIDSPADVKTLRQLVLSKIPLQDYSVSSLDQQYDPGSDGRASTRVASSARKNARSAADMRQTPEALLLGQEHDDAVGQLAGQFLDKLRKAVNNNPQRYSRLVRTLWHCYYDPTEPAQIEIAKKLGVSDSLVSDNRRLIEHELKKLDLAIEDGAAFSESLAQLVTLNMS
jgi:hypothetical protein